MAIPFLNNLDLNQNQALNMRLHQLATAPAGVSGQVYYNTANNRIGWHDGTTWQEIFPSATTNTANTDVRRDASGNFAAGTITATLSGNASTATTLATARDFSITGKATAAAVSFNGSGNVALNITALSVVPGDIALANGSFIVGNGSGVGAATAKNLISISGFGAAAADVAMGGFKITGLADPVSPQDAATKAYVDAVSVGLDVKQSVRLATTAPLAANTYSSATKRITASANAALQVDGTFVSVGNRILVKNEASAANNGIYVVIVGGDAYTPWVLERAPDFDTSAEASPGSFTFVEEGTALSDTGWVMTANATVVLDTTGLTWAQFSGAGTYIAGRGLVLDGNTFHFAQIGAYTVGDIFVASGASTIAPLAAVATGNVLISGGTGVAPSWGKVGLTTHITGTLGVSNGGTGATSLTTNGVLLGNGTSAITAAAPSAASQILIANASSVPTWVAMTGDVQIGSTGITAIGANKVLDTMLRQGAATSVIGRSANSTGNVADIAASADGQIFRRVGGTLGFGQLISSSTITGNGSTASFTVTHNLGTRDVVVMVYQSASPYAQIFTDVEMATTNTVTVRFAANVANGTAYRVVVIGF